MSRGLVLIVDDEPDMVENCARGSFDHDGIRSQRISSTLLGLWRTTTGIVTLPRCSMAATTPRAMR